MELEMKTCKIEITKVKESLHFTIWGKNPKKILKSFMIVESLDKDRGSTLWISNDEVLIRFINQKVKKCQ